MKDLLVDGQPVESRTVPLWWHTAGKQYTASGYGRRIPTPYMVKIGKRWRRVYCCIYSNSGTCYVEGTRNPATGKRSWMIVERF